MYANVSSAILRGTPQLETSGARQRRIERWALGRVMGSTVKPSAGGPDPVQEPVPQGPEAEVLWKLEVGVSMVSTSYIRRQR